MITQVGIVGTTHKRDRFFLQLKDSNHKYPFHYCFFGGQLEDKETPRECLEREIRKKLTRKACAILLENSYKAVTHIAEWPGEKIHYILYESIVPELELNKIGSMKVYEGSRSVVLERRAVDDINFIPQLSSVLMEYLKSYK